MKLRIQAESAPRLSDYERIPVLFDVTERLDLVAAERKTCALSLQRRPVKPSYVKDYDRIPGQRPSEWHQRWDLSKWEFAAAFLDERRIGGAAVVMDTSEVEGAVSSSGALAVLWDIRVCPEFRRRGIGRELLRFAENRAHMRGIRRMKVETQNINVAACRFYAHNGYVLIAIDPSAYADFPDEVQLIWQKDLDSAAPNH